MENKQNKRGLRGFLLILLAIIAVAALSTAIWAVKTHAAAPAEEPPSETIALPQSAWLKPQEAEDGQLFVFRV